ncbi:porin [Paraburkholderia sp. XV]|uniref:porin n=1 Tax=Paraburkholderia sp. XV TaxID=2831520 RepID=UPI001CD42B38|nr:porin [Paraburkholderia sp. XV]
MSVKAQSSLTFYGLIDVGLNYRTSDGANPETGKSASAVSLSSSNEQTSRWGLVGYEELGNGMKATFRLESGFNAATGVGNFGLPFTNDTNSLFDRGASIGIISPYGTITGGRVYSPLRDALVAADASGYLNFGSLSTILYQNSSNVSPALGLAGKTTGTYSLVNGGLLYTWVNNSIKYTIPDNTYGFSGGALYSFGGTAGSLKNKSTWSANLNWTNGTISLISGYYSASDPGGVTSNSWLRAFTLGLLYATGPVQLGFDFTNIRNPTTGANQDFFYTSARWQITSFVSVVTDWIYLKDLQNGQASSDLYKLEANYSLSKSTALYTGVGFVNNKPQGVLGSCGFASPMLSPALMGHNQLSIIAGIRKFF